MNHELAAPIEQNESVLGALVAPKDLLPILPPPGVVLFDLDGTLVDPAGGITQGIAYALAEQGIAIPAQSVLDSMVGPKLADGLVNIIGVPVESVNAVVSTYRDWYQSTGMGMSKVYPGLRKLLSDLRHAGYSLAVATQKPEPLAKQLLETHGLDSAFDIICGAHPDELLAPGEPGYRADKTEIIAHAVRSLTAGTDKQAVMVGDRHQDVNGAAANNLQCIGVNWGFAPDGELIDAGAIAVVNNAAELAFVLGLEKQQSGSSTANPAAARQSHHDASEATNQETFNGAL